MEDDKSVAKRVENIFGFAWPEAVAWPRCVFVTKAKPGHFREKGDSLDREEPLGATMIAAVRGMGRPGLAEPTAGLSGAIFGTKITPSGFGIYFGLRPQSIPNPLGGGRWATLCLYACASHARPFADADGRRRRQRLEGRCA